jgi:tight adherence protein C
LRSLVATLKQSIKFGTPLAESLRMIAGEMRAARQARIEERAARLPVLLAIPMMLFILPCLLMIVGTPVVLRMMDVFKNIIIGAP